MYDLRRRSVEVTGSSGGEGTVVGLPLLRCLHVEVHHCMSHRYEYLGPKNYSRPCGSGVTIRRVSVMGEHSSLWSRRALIA